MSVCVYVCMEWCVEEVSELWISKLFQPTTNKQQQPTHSLTRSSRYHDHQVVIKSPSSRGLKSRLTHPSVLSSNSGLDQLHSPLHLLLNHLRSSTSLPLSFTHSLTHSLTLHSLHFALCIQQPTQYYNK